MGSTAARQRRGLMAALAAAALLLVAYLVLPGLLAEDTEAEEETASLLGVSADEITSLSWTYDGETVSIELTDDEWVLADDVGIELNQTTAEGMADALAEATVLREIDAADVTDDMGLNNPSITATLGLSDGSALELVLGETAGSGEGTYARVGDDEGACVASSGLASELARTRAELYASESGPNATETTSLVIEANGGSVTLSYDEDGNDELSYSSSYTWFVSDGQSQATAADTSEAEELANLINYVSWESVANPAWDGTGDYGFDAPTLTATLAYTTSSTTETTNDDGETEYETVETPGTYTLVVGCEAPDGSYYAQPEGSSRVYTLAASDVETLLEASVESLAATDVVVMDWDTVTSLELSCDGGSVTLEFGEDSEGEAGYTADGEELDASLVEAVEDAIDALSAEGEATSDEAGALEGAEPYLSVSFRRDSERWGEMTLELVRYDSSYYLVRFNGRANQLVGRAQARELAEAIEAVL